VSDIKEKMRTVKTVRILNKTWEKLIKYLEVLKKV